MERAPAHQIAARGPQLDPAALHQPRHRDLRPFHGDRLKALRTEAGWSQAELAEKIDSDARQVSRYENNRVAPGLDALIRIAQVFNVSVDYLLIENAERRPLTAPSNHLDARLADLDQLTDEERTTITNVIDALVTKAKLRLITGNAG